MCAELLVFNLRTSTLSQFSVFCLKFGFPFCWLSILSPNWVVPFAWWTFRLRKKKLAPRPPHSPIRCRHPPAPRPLSLETPPPSWDFQLKIDPPPPGASDSPFRLPRAEKIYICIYIYIRNVHQVCHAKE